MSAMDFTINPCFDSTGFSPKAAYFTLGCKLNFSETSTIGKMLAQRGIMRISEGETPDICVVNTCSVTEMADKKGRSLIRRISRQWPKATLVVTGCYAQLKPEEVAAIEGVDIVLGSNEKLRIAEYLDKWSAQRRKIVDTTAHNDIRSFAPSCERGDRTRFFLKVQDGCDYFCSYCTIPFARGRSRSGKIEDVVEQARRAAESGGREIVLTGVNVGEFGNDNGQDFFSLLKALDEVEGIERFRISSIEPNLLTSEVIAWIANESRAFMPHFHLPLQSGSDKVLSMMRRRYDTSLFEKRVYEIKSAIPEAFIGVDVIAGARGEDDDEWRKSYKFIESLPIARLHVFPYSERPGTLALRLDGEVSQEVKHRRVADLTALSDAKLAQFFAANTGCERKVLWEHLLPGGELMTGLTDNYIRVAAPSAPDLLNTIGTVRLNGVAENYKETMSGIII